jgi:hypothetical protein
LISRIVRKSADYTYPRKPSSHMALVSAVAKLFTVEVIPRSDVEG